ncbi:hypothetical protein RQP46_006500 [Phenoliferia psychrophenolica]
MRIPASFLILATATFATARLAKRAPLKPSVDPFYVAPAGWEDASPGAVLRSRQITPAFLNVIPLPLTSWQLLYRTTDGDENPAATVTTIYVLLGALVGITQSNKAFKESFESVATPKMMAVVKTTGDQCLVSPSATLVDFLTAEYLTTGLATLDLPVWKATLENLKLGASPSLVPKIPLHIVHAKGDELIPWAVAAAMVSSYCAEDDTSLEFITNDTLGVEHIVMDLISAPGAIQFLTDRLDGVPFAKGYAPTATTLSPSLATDSEDSLKLATADCAIALLSHAATAARLESLLPLPSTSTAPPPSTPSFGSRDTKVLGMLAGVVGRWGIASRVLTGVLPASVKDRKDGAPPAAQGRFAEVVEDEPDTAGLEEVVRNTLEVVLLEKGVHRDSPAGQLAAIVLPQLLLPLVGALVQLAHGPHESDTATTWAKTSLARLLRMNTPIVVLSTLLALTSAAYPTHAWLRPNLANLLSAQLLRPGGVRSLLILVAGNEDEVGLAKLEMLARLLGASPTGMDSEAYSAAVTAQLLAVLSTSANAAIVPLSKSTLPPPMAPPAAVTRAAAFVYSTLVSQSPALVLPLHALLLPTLSPPQPSTSLSPKIISSSSLLLSLSLISTLLLYSPPIPTLLPTLLSPLLPLLLSLSSFLSPPSEDNPAPPISIFAPPTDPRADERLRDETDALLETWGKALPVDEALQGVLRAVEAIEKSEEWGPRTLSEDEEGQEEEYAWGRDDNDGQVVLTRHSRQSDDAMNVRLEPEGVVRILGSIGRKELSAKAFLRWLDEVQVLRAQDGLEAAKRSVLRLQLVLKMVEEMGAELLEDPTQIIAFVAHALDASGPADEDEGPKVPKEPKLSSGLGLDDLKIVEEGEEAEDEEEGVVPGLGPDEMAVTALTLLLAVLEANEDLNMTSTPLLSLIFARLPALAALDSTLIPPLAREARLVLSVRLASTLPPTSSTPSTDPLHASRQTYQEALKLLSDPLLPVRAQGLAHLRSLVATRDALLSTDPALIPAVLDIFVQAVEDDDSFLYLNAIQGLSGLVDAYGRKVVLRLVEVYVGGRSKVAGVGKGETARREMDKRLRMGEALVQVVQRAAEAVALFADDLLPALLAVLRQSDLPTPLRSSALTILATTVESAPTAMVQYADTLADACLTLLSLESRPLQPRRAASPPPLPTDPNSDSESNSEEEEPAPPQLDRNGKPKRPEETPDPHSSSAKSQPSLRRAAVLFLGLLFRTAAELAVMRSPRTTLQSSRKLAMGHTHTASTDELETQGYYAAILTPAFGVSDLYSGDIGTATSVATEYNSLATFLFVWNGVFTIIFIASLRTNFCLAIVFFGVMMGVWCLAGMYVQLAAVAGATGAGSATMAVALSKAGGAFLFLSACSGFYLVCVQLFESVDFPFTLPVGDLSRFWPKKKTEYAL